MNNIIKKYSDFNNEILTESKLNEYYKEPKEYKINSYGWNVPVYTYTDKVFDNIINIIMNVNGISEKNFKQIDETKNYVESYFDNNQDILLIIDDFNKKEKRAEYCSEKIYDEHFSNKYKIDESASLLEKKKSKYISAKEHLENSKSIKNEMKEKILNYISSGSRYKDGVLFGLKKPKIKDKTFDGVGFGADKDGFFVYTHRARCKSYPTPEQIPDIKIKFIKSTG